MTPPHVCHGCLLFLAPGETRCEACARCTTCCPCVALARVDVGEVRVRKPEPEVRTWQTDRVTCQHCPGRLFVDHQGLTLGTVKEWATAWSRTHRCAGRVT